MKLVKESLYNFHKTGDVKSGLNIGMRAKIIAWLDEMGVENYTINEDFTIDVDGNVYIRDKNLESFPDYIKFNIVNRGFNCSDNQLVSLEGAPKEVGGHFYCHNNRLTSLEGGPKEVGGSFSCSSNRLISLEGAPQKIGENFYGLNNKRKFSEEEIRAVCKVKGRIYT